MRAPPARHWRSYGDQKLPTGAEALEEPFSAFPSWFLRITCDRCGKVQIVKRGAREGLARQDPAADPRPDARRWAHGLGRNRPRGRRRPLAKIW